MKRILITLACITAALLLYNSRGVTQSTFSTTKDNGPQEIRECEGHPDFVYTVCMGTSPNKCAPTMCMPALNFKYNR